MKRTILSLALAAGTVAMAGCANTTQVRDTTLDDDPALKTIQEATRHIEKQNSMLVQIEQAENPTPSPTQKPANEEFDRLVYLRNWNGSATKAVSRVAEIMGYRSRITGNIPAIEPLVSIDANGETAYDVLMDISDQGNRQYDIRVNIKERVINIAFLDKRS